MFGRRGPRRSLGRMFHLGKKRDIQWDVTRRAMLLDNTMASSKLALFESLIQSARRSR